MARRTFFSFHYKNDVHRSWNVRNSWVTKDREDAGFFDNGLWEKKQRESDDSIKQLIRDGVHGTSVLCVLNGSQTALRRWVRYEIARGILNKNGILTIDIHSVKNMDGETSVRGVDPLDNIGLYRTNGSVYFCEKVNGQWRKYTDYSLAIDEKLLWFGAPQTDRAQALSKHFGRFDFVAQRGRDNMGEWIEDAAIAAGR
jgi:hypothetical protein